MGACKMGVVYEILVACSQVCIGQTGRCFTGRATEHKHNVNNKTTSSRLFMHLRECRNCFPCWDECAFRNHKLDPVKRVIKEARRIGLAGSCISAASVVFNNDTNVIIVLKKEKIPEF